MILIITNPEDGHLKFVIPHLHKRRLKFKILDPNDLLHNVYLSVSIGDCYNARLFYNKKESVNLEDVISIWYRRPGIVQAPKEITEEVYRSFIVEETKEVLRGIFKNFEGLWVNDPLRIQQAGYKLHQLKVAKALGFRVPKTLVTSIPEEVKNFYEQCEGQIIFKTLAQGGFNIDGKNYDVPTNPFRVQDFQFIDRVRYCPCLFQEYIPKQVEIRVTVVGNQIFAAEIHSQANERTRHDWRRYADPMVPHFPHKLPLDIEELCIKLLTYYGLEFGAIDMVLTPQGEYVFLEINPNGQWAWIEELTGLPIAHALVDLLQSGTRSYGKNVV
jgi:glutathione synthase/RimK-type ligase-like ATP-grasp enzyme